MARELRIGLALGSGGARGAAHTGVLKVLEREGVRPTVVAGSSIGALIGAAYIVGKPTADMEREWLAVGMSKMLRGFMPTFPSAGLSSGHELSRLLRALFGDVLIEDLPMPFAAVTCDIDTGEQVVLTTGSLVDAIRASTAIPGIFFPVRHGARILVDGGMVDPVPVSACRAQQLLCLPESAPLPGHVVIFAADAEARSRTFAVAASLLRHIPAEAVYLSIHAADTPQSVRAEAMRALLDARSAALADHGLDMRTEIRVGDPVTELLRELLAHEPAMLVVGIGAESAAAAEWLPQMIEGPVQRPVLIVRAPAAGRSGDA